MNKVALVAGGAGGIGSAICTRLAQESAVVLCADFSERRGSALVETLVGAGHKAHFVRLDVGDASSWQAAVESCIERFGGLHILVNAAYRAKGGPLHELSDADWRANFNVTLDGVFYGMRAALAHMGAGSSIVNIASIASFVAMPVNTGYGAAKAGLVALSKIAAATYASRGIRINVISPGFITTKALEGLGDLMAQARGNADAALAELLARIPLGEFGRPDDMASAVAFLASEDARYLTGAELVVDGGYTIA